MRMRNYLLPALAMFVMLASCQKDGAQTTVETGGKKSVTVTIANIAAPATRAIQEDGFTDAGVPIAALEDLTVFFADGDGVVVDSRALDEVDGEDVDTDIITKDETPIGKGTSYVYTFHRVPENAAQLVITNVAIEENLDELGDAIDDALLEDWQALPGELQSIPVWGENIKWDLHEDEVDEADGLPLYDAGTIEIAPVLARIEIGNIQCLNLGGQTANAVTGYPRFGSFTLENIGIHDTNLSTIAGGEDDPFTYDADEDGLDAWLDHIDAEQWNINSVGSVLLDSSADKYDGDDGNVFGFNVVPGAVPNIILEITGATENVITENNPEGKDLIPGEVDDEAFYYVKTTSLKEGTTPIGSFKAGYIYKVDFKFNTENVLPWNQEEEFICVDVTVVIPNWVIYAPVLTPGFE